MADIPDQIVLKVARDREGRRDVKVRRILLSAVVLLLGLGLFNLFGQRPATTTAEADAATLEVYSPKRVRGGLFFEARFTIEARREVEVKLPGRYRVTPQIAGAIKAAPGIVHVEIQ